MFRNIKPEFYYVAPPESVFKDIKTHAMKLWRKYPNEHGYVDEKVNRIIDIENIRDNAWYIVSMFDTHNQAELWRSLSEKSKAFIRGISETNEEQDNGRE